VRTLKLTVAYDGTRFVGWQRQAEGESIQGTLEGVLARFEGAPVTLHGAGRTDAGVHALRQVASARVSFSLDAPTLMRALNAQLPDDVRVVSVEEAAPDFHARYSARSKTYRYQIRNTPTASPFERYWVWHVPEPLDVRAMNEAAAALVGTHDFGAFRSAGTDVGSTVRTIFESGWREHDGVLTYQVSGGGFLRHMVRAIVGTLVDVGRGRRPPGDMTVLLHGGTRAQAGATAPPHGLILARVDYD
jgi:tRNA pseudouridine38-40 synthase